MNNPQAFPKQNSEYDGQGHVLQYQEDGMTLRDYFAGQALMSMLSPVQDIKESTPMIASHLAYEFADAMLEERSKDERG